MRLTNEQINALVAQEATNFEKANKIKEVKPTKQQINKAKKYAALLKQIPEEITHNLRYVTFSSVTEQAFLNQIMHLEHGVATKPTFDKTAYRNKILIASIDSNDLKELQEKLK